MRELEYTLWHLFGWEKSDMHCEPVVDNRTPEICPHCGEHMLGDGYRIPYHCPNAYEELWWYSEPDSGPWLCSIDDDYDEPTEMDEWASFDPDC